MSDLPQLLIDCCARANGSRYAYPGAGGDCGCPSAQFIWQQKRVAANFCGYPEIGSASSPPKYYSTLTWTGGLTQIVEHLPQHFEGTTGNNSVTISGITIPGHSSYDINVTAFDAYTNNYTGFDSFGSPMIEQIVGGTFADPCGQITGSEVTWTALTSITTDYAYTPLAGGSTVSGSIPSTAIPTTGAGGVFTPIISSPVGYGNLAPIDAVPQLMPPSTHDASAGNVSGTWSPVSSTAEIFNASGAGWTGYVSQTLSAEQVESTLIASATPQSVTFAGSTLGGTGGFVERLGQDWQADEGPSAGDGIDYVGPLWADREGRAIDWANAVTFALLITKLVPGLPMKATVRVFRASYGLNDTGAVPAFGSPSQVGTDLTFAFTPSHSWALIGADAPSGFNPESFDPSALNPTETVIAGSVSQGWIYGAKIIAIEPQSDAL